MHPEAYACDVPEYELFFATVYKLWTSPVCLLADGRDVYAGQLCNLLSCSLLPLQVPALFRNEREAADERPNRGLHCGQGWPGGCSKMTSILDGVAVVLL